MMHHYPNYTWPHLSCRVDEHLMQLVPLMRGYLSFMQRQVRLDSQTFSDLEPYPNEGSCNFGELTGRGAAQHVLVGDALRKQYIDMWKLIDEERYSEQILIRSTTRARTYRSALAFMYGLLPNFSLEQLQIESAPTNNMLSNVDDQQARCQGISKYSEAFSPTFNQNVPSIREASVRLYTHLKKVFGESVDAMRVGDMFDIGAVHYCHNMTSPRPQVSTAAVDAACVPKWAMHDIVATMQENGALRVASPDYQRVAILRMYPLLSEIVSRMEQQAAGSSTLRFVLYSGHDSTIDPLVTALHAADGTWPRYASRVVFELYAAPHANHGAATNDQFVVRVLYQGIVITSKITCCQASGRLVSGELCPLDVFARCMREDLLSELGEEKYKEACEKPVY